jgi:membrane-associated phospholipid phosphatase
VFPRSAIALAAAFAAFAGLVAAGAFTRLDQWSIRHLMPGAELVNKKSNLAEGVVPLYHVDWHSGTAVAVNLVTLPASFLVALAIVFWRSRPLAVALVLAVGVEVLCKGVLDRPPLYGGTLHLRAFDSSFPSGHSLRTVLVAAALWPLLRGSVLVWAAASLVLIEIAGWHTPTDIAGGVLLGLLALLCARGVGALRARRLRA